MINQSNPILDRQKMKVTSLLLALLFLLLRFATHAHLPLHALLSQLNRQLPHADLLQTETLHLHVHLLLALQVLLAHELLVDK